MRASEDKAQLLHVEFSSAVQLCSVGDLYPDFEVLGAAGYDISSLSVRVPVLAFSLLPYA